MFLLRRSPAGTSLAKAIERRTSRSPRGGGTSQGRALALAASSPLAAAAVCHILHVGLKFSSSEHGHVPCLLWCKWSQNTPCLGDLASGGCRSLQRC